MEQPSYYSILTANVRYDKTLKANEKLLFSEITALSNKNGYCHARNKYFADLYGVSKISVSNWINHLKACGYLKVEMIKEGKEIKGRHLYPISAPIKENFNTPSRKLYGGVKENFNTPIKENFKENTTSINTTSINKPLTDGHHSLQDVFNLWQQSWGFPNGIAQQDLTEWNNEFGADLLYYCVEYALRRNISSKGADRYLYKKLNAYKEQGIKTVAGAKKDDERHEQQMNREYQGKRRGYNAPQVRETLPDWWGKDYSESSSDSDYQVPDDSQDVMPDD